MPRWHRIAGADPLLEKLQNLGVQCDPAAGAALFNPELQHSLGNDRTAGSIAIIRANASRGLLRGAMCRRLLLPLPAPTPSLHEKIRDFAAALSPLSDALETRQRLDESRALCDERTAERDRCWVNGKRWMPRMTGLRRRMNRRLQTTGKPLPSGMPSTRSTMHSRRSIRPCRRSLPRERTRLPS